MAMLPPDNNFHRSNSQPTSSSAEKAATNSKASKSARRSTWSQRNCSTTHTAPTPPKWRFVNDAKKTSGYSSHAAGSYIQGKSAQELAIAAARHYTNGDFDIDRSANAGDNRTQVGKLPSINLQKNIFHKELMEVGKLDIEEPIERSEEFSVGRPSQQKEGTQVAAETSPAAVSTREETKKEETQMDTSQDEEQEVEEAVEKERTMMIIPQIDDEEELEEIEKTNADTEEHELQSSAKEEIAETSMFTIVGQMNEKHPPSSRQRRRCLLLLSLALPVIVAIIIGVQFGVGNMSKGAQNAVAMVNETNSTLEEAASRCPTNEKYVSIHNHARQSSPSSNGTDTTTTRRITSSAAATSTDTTWSLKDACSGEVLMKCEPCLFSDEGDIEFMFIEKGKRTTGSLRPPSSSSKTANAEGEDIRRMLKEDDFGGGMCVPEDREYVFEVIKTDGTGDRCCNFDVTTFYVTFDDVTVVNATDKDSEVASTSFNGEGAGLCPTISSTLLPSVFPSLSVQLTPHLSQCKFCPYCRWRYTNFVCTERVEYLVRKYELSWEEAPIAVMNTGECIDYWCDYCLWSPANGTTTTCKERLEFTLVHENNTDEGTFKRDTMENGLCEQLSDCSVELYVSPPTPECIAAGEDLNLCIAIDMSGSVCNRGTGYKCTECVPHAMCNDDGVDLSTCCGNFHNVIQFSKAIISIFGTIPSDQSYSIVGFATNTSFVSNLETTSDAYRSLDNLVYTGGVTNHAGAISSCQQKLSEVDGRKKVILLITDGEPSEPEDTAKEDAIIASTLAKEAGSILIPVMISEDSIDNRTTKYMTEISSRKLFFNTSLSTLDSFEESILSKVMCQWI